MVSPPPTAETVRAWLEKVPDPEIPVLSVVDLGILRDVRQEGETLIVTITPTYSGCPATEAIRHDIEAALRERGVGKLRIETRLSPPWSTDWLSEKGRAALERYGIAPPGRGGRPARCPRCGGTDLRLVSQFGSTPCKAQWQCESCLEPFDHFKCI